MKFEVQFEIIVWFAMNSHRSGPDTVQKLSETPWPPWSSVKSISATIFPSHLHSQSPNPSPGASGGGGRGGGDGGGRGGGDGGDGGGDGGGGDGAMASSS